MVDYLNEIINDAIENGMNPKNAKNILKIIKNYIINGEFPMLGTNDWENIIYRIIDNGYSPSKKNKNGIYYPTLAYDNYYVENQIYEYFNERKVK